MKKLLFFNLTLCVATNLTAATIPSAAEQLATKLTFKISSDGPPAGTLTNNPATGECWLLSATPWDHSIAIADYDAGLELRMKVNNNELNFTSLSNAQKELIRISMKDICFIGVTDLNDADLWFNPDEQCWYITQQAHLRILSLPVTVDHEDGLHEHRALKSLFRSIPVVKDDEHISAVAAGRHETATGQHISSLQSAHYTRPEALRLDRFIESFHHFRDTNRNLSWEAPVLTVDHGLNLMCHYFKLTDCVKLLFSSMFWSFAIDSPERASA